MRDENSSVFRTNDSPLFAVKTVEFHRNSLMDELGVHSIAELTRYAMTCGIAL